MAGQEPFHFFGIRHHGPGCARSLRSALEALGPDCLLVEGPPEGEALLGWLDDAELRPPVALLVHDPDTPSEASFFPFAEFSPEWIALRFARERGIEARFVDLPVGHELALAREAAAARRAGGEDQAGGEAEDLRARERPASSPPGAEVPREPPGDEPECCDPLDWLGRAAGYGDGEAWWNHLVEERCDGLELFAAIAEAMHSLRAEGPPRLRDPRRAAREALREAHMRKCLRAARKDGFQRIAVVCGAWHVPALMAMPPAREDAERLAGLPRSRVSATWVPWSYGKLSQASGYRAGVLSPAWYEHLWHHPGEERGLRWLARAAGLFRSEGIDCSSAHIIEAVRLADSLAALRERPRPGLAELSDALLGVVCCGDPAPMKLVERALMIGDRLGAIPSGAPAVPLQQDLERLQKRLRLKPEASQRTLDLDLRNPNDLARSHLLHRLDLLAIGWGRLRQAGHGARGSFHEIWSLEWEPELALAVIDAARWGNTVPDAAGACAVARAREADSLPELARLVDRVLLADLGAAVGPLTRALEERAARAPDVAQLLEAVPPLANVVRYGNVRGTDAAMVGDVLQAVVPRAAIGLPGACSALDDDAAAAMRQAIVGAHQALQLIADEGLLEAWLPALLRLAEPGGCHGRVCGLAARLRFDAGADGADETARRMGLALSAAVDPAPAAAWLEGFLNGNATVLLHDAALWALVDRWLAALGEEHFTRVLPLLRRAFSEFTAPERRRLGERAARPADAAARPEAVAQSWDSARGDRALPLLAALLGIDA